MELFGPGFVDYEARGLDVSRRALFIFPGEPLSRRGPGSRRGGEGRAGALALDLFAGVGLFSVPLAKRFERVVAVESNPAAARDLEANSRRHDRVRTADVEPFLERYREKAAIWWSARPSARGFDARRDQAARALPPERITYVSCEPPTLARDLAGACAGRLRNFRNSPVRSFSPNISHGGGGPAPPARMKLPVLWIAVTFAAGAVVSNRWPKPPHLWLVAALGAIVLGACFCGAVTAVTDGQNLSVHSYVEQSSESRLRRLAYLHHPVGCLYGSASWTPSTWRILPF